jgi:hypothetical protein
MTPRCLLALVVVGAVSACANRPPPPDWSLNAQGAAERAVAAALTGNARAEAAEASRLRREIAATGQPALLARAELLRCAARVAALDFEPCVAYDALAVDAGPAERAYAAWLGARPAAGDVPLLPPHHQPAARSLLAPVPATGPELALLAAIDDPLARLVAAGVWLRAGRGHPAVVALAVETASAQGWSRPLAAWLGVQLRQAEAAGDQTGAAATRRRLELVLSGGAAR